MRPKAVIALAGLVAGGALWAQRKNPSACPYALRFFVEGPHPGIPRERLIEALAPAPGERLLEIGPGTGYYSLDVAPRLDGGTLAVLDVQREFLEHVAKEASD